MTSGPLPIRDDIFGFVQAFLTPRQGVDDNTNPKPPKQEPQNAAPGPQPTTGVGPADAPAPGAQPIQMPPPQPAGVRQVPEGSVSPVASPGLQQGDAAILQQNWAWRMMMAQQEQLRAKAAEAKRWDTAMSGLAGLAGGLGGGSYAAGQGGFGGAPAAGSSRATGSDAFSLEEIRQFGDDATKAAAAAANAQTVAAFKKAHPEMNPADIDAAVAGGDYGRLRELGLNLTDPESRAKAATADEKVAKEKEFRTIMSDPQLAARLMAATGVSDPVVLRTLFDAGKLDTVLEKAAQGGPDYAEYLKAYPGGKDPRTGKPFTYADYLGQKQTAASPTGGLANILGKEVGKQIGDQVERSRTQMQALPSMVQLYEDLRTGQGAIGGIVGRDDALALQKLADGLGIDMKGAQKTQEMAAIIGGQVLARAKALGSNPTDADREYIKAMMGGDFSNSREALIAIARTNIKASIQTQIEANNRINGVLEHTTDPQQRAMLESQLQRPADHTNLIFGASHQAAMDAALADPDPKARERVSANIDRYYGPGMADYYYGTKGK